MFTGCEKPGIQKHFRERSFGSARESFPTLERETLHREGFLCTSEQNRTPRFREPSGGSGRKKSPFKSEGHRSTIYLLVEIINIKWWAGITGILGLLAYLTSILTIAETAIAVGGSFVVWGILRGILELVMRSNERD